MLHKYIIKRASCVNEISTCDHVCSARGLNKKETLARMIIRSDIKIRKMFA